MRWKDDYLLKLYTLLVLVIGLTFNWCICLVSSLTEMCLVSSLSEVCFCDVFRYRKWDLGNGLQLVARCEHDAATYGPNSELQLVNIKALNEWDSRVSHVLVSTSRDFLGAAYNVTAIIIAYDDIEQTKGNNYFLWLVSCTLSLDTYKPTSKRCMFMDNSCYNFGGCLSHCNWE